MNKETLLTQTGNCLAALIDSTFLDTKEMGNDCLENFDIYDWLPKSHLNATEKKLWEELLTKGNAGEMDSKELSQFLELTSPDGQTHVYYYRIQAQKLLHSLQENESMNEADENQFTFTLKDECSNSDGDINGRITNKHQLGVSVHFDGYSDCCSKDDVGTPIYVEKYNGDLRVIIYSDINNEKPTHIISLEGARNTKRLA